MDDRTEKIHECNEKRKRFRYAGDATLTPTTDDIDYLLSKLKTAETGEQGVINVSEQHDFVQIKDSDKCGLRGCTLGVLEHAWIPPVFAAFGK